MKQLSSLLFNIFFFLVAVTSSAASAFVAPTCSRAASIRARQQWSRADLSYKELFQQQLVLSSTSSSMDDKETSSTVTTARKYNLDHILPNLTSMFPFFVLSAAIGGLVRPSLLTWVNQGNLISAMLASVMCGTGLGLENRDFAKVFTADHWKSVPLGVLCQYLIMPAAAWAVGKALLLPWCAAATTTSGAGPALFLGLCLVGCSPGGTASNLVSLIAKADVALSVILTASSTLIAVVMTPLLVKLLVGSEIQVSGMVLCQATARVVLLPVLLGMWLKAKTPRLANAVSRFTPFASVLLVSLICGGVVAQNAPLLSGGALGVARTIPVIVMVSVILLHTVGFAAGYGIPKLVFGRDEKSSRTISIEVGMQNSALAVVLARSIGAPALASLPGALSATVHSCLGSMLAAYWRLSSDTNDTTNTDNGEAANS
jgi:bile acid:Na+ symporter, BASS family